MIHYSKINGITFQGRTLSMDEVKSLPSRGFPAVDEAWIDGWDTWAKHNGETYQVGNEIREQLLEIADNFHRLTVSPQIVTFPKVTTTTEAKPCTIEELGFFGNVWVRSHFYEKAGDFHAGHEHQFDHASFLTQGKASVQVGDRETIFTAPAWIIIKATEKHKITALEDKTVWWCVFALRDVDGNPLDVFDPAKHSPYGNT